MAEHKVPVTGVHAVNSRGELALFIEPAAASLRPTRIRRVGNSLAVLSEDTPVSVRGYGERAVDAARRKRQALVVELDERTAVVSRESMVPIEEA
jgi:50S ribosomal subunit-associated GTPase HflX